MYWDLDPRDRERATFTSIPTSSPPSPTLTRLTAEVAGLREQVGGSVFRVVDSKLTELGERIAKLNKKAVKLGTEPITLTVSDEHDQEVIRELAPDATDAVEAAGGRRGLDPRLRRAGHRLHLRDRRRRDAA